MFETRILAILVFILYSEKVFYEYHTRHSGSFRAEACVYVETSKLETSRLHFCTTNILLVRMFAAAVVCEYSSSNSCLQQQSTDACTHT